VQAAFTADEENAEGYVELDYQQGDDYSLYIHFRDQSTGPIVRWEWNYGYYFIPAPPPNNQPARIEDVFYTSTDPEGWYADTNGLWTVTLTVYDADGCMDTVTKFQYVHVTGCG
jgi:hypothetical protein